MGKYLASIKDHLALPVLVSLPDEEELPSLFCLGHGVRLEEDCSPDIGSSRMGKVRPHLLRPVLRSLS